ncbi:hypothetical protein EZV61_14790 [Corallincola luteus]|uniref:Uncharacterized protein n=1 Tax=Corallincola luteus TaxID=1775177 RepID=A0ABY2AJQ6_9GAMM|nr:type II toxin-antitoxin system YafO family toxin [Corallincola luteus]TCI02200.1 hypothetical protein EZV61_14790 [Corallincola luteus]
MTAGKASVFVHPRLKVEGIVNSTLSALVKDFIKYKSGEYIHYFGKDVGYIRPEPYAERAELKHLHVLDKVKSIQMRGNTSNAALIYTVAATRLNTYCIIDFVAEEAHETARDMKQMREWIAAAESFRDKF